MASTSPDPERKQVLDTNPAQPRKGEIAPQGHFSTARAA
jgi:hypothetical protein